MNNKVTIEEDLELNVLANIATYPERAFHVIDGLGITAEDFVPGARRDAYGIMLRHGGDRTELLLAIKPALPELFATGDATNRFLDRAPSIGEIEHHLLAFLQHAIRRDTGKQLWETVHDRNLPPDLLADELTRVISGMSERLERLSRFVGGEAAEAEADADAARTPDALLDVPGFVNALAQFTYSVAPRPNRVLAFAGALAMLSFLTARKYTDKFNTTTNIYMIALANSGVGKDIIRKVNKQLADDISMSECLTDGIGSGEGLEDALFQTPAKLALMDEFSTVLNSIKDLSTINEHILGALLTFFTEAKSVHTLRCKALTSAVKQDMMNNPYAVQQMKSPKIYCPSLTLLATSIPDKFYSSLTSRLLDNGMLARFLIFEAGERGDANMAPQNLELPRAIVDFAQQLASKDHKNGWNNKPEFIVVDDAEGVSEMRVGITREADAHYHACEKEQDRVGMSVWNRAVEIANKLALLYALSENLLDPHITEHGLGWAWKVVVHSSQRMLKMAGEYLSVDRDDKDAQDVLRIVRDSGRKGILRSLVMNRAHLTKKRMDGVEETLIDRDQIEVIKGMKNSKIYRAKKTKGAK